jgi:hypothetical protein
MLLDTNKLIHLFRYFWWLLALACCLYVLNANILRARNLNYQFDLSTSLNRDWYFYPSERTSYQENDQTGDKFLSVLAEPLYLQVYLPVKFEQAQLAGYWSLSGQDLDIGLKQQDSSWQWQKVTDDNFSLTFDLAQASTKNNKLEFIFSLPNLSESVEAQLHSLSLNLER